MAEILMDVEPLAGPRYVAVTERRTKQDEARPIQQRRAVRYPHVITVRLMLDHVHTYRLTSRHDAVPREDARR